MPARWPPRVLRDSIMVREYMHHMQLRLQSSASGCLSDRATVYLHWSLNCLSIFLGCLFSLGCVD